MSDDATEGGDPPELLEGFGGWYEDFWSLSTERQIGMAIGPIPQSHIDRMAACMSYEDAEMFEYCMRKMDEAYLRRAGSDEPTIAPGPPPRFSELAGGV